MIARIKMYWDKVVGYERKSWRLSARTPIEITDNVAFMCGIQLVYRNRWSRTDEVEIALIRHTVLVLK